MNNKIVILPSNTDLNRGDQALIWETFEVAKDAGFVDDMSNCVLFDAGTNPVEIEIQKKQSIEKGYRFASPILSHPEALEFKLKKILSQRKSSRNTHEESVKYSRSRKLLWSINALFDLLTSSLLLVPSKKINTIGKLLLSDKKRKGLKEIEEAKAIFVKGGGFIHSLDKSLISSYYVYYSVYHIWLASKLEKPVYIMPNSYGPFPSKLSKYIIRKSMKNVTFISARENISQSVIENVLERNVKTFADLGFYLNVSNNHLNDAEKYLISINSKFKNKKSIGITVRPYRFPNSNNPTKAYEKYILSIKEFVEFAVNNNYDVYLISQTLGPSDHENDYLAIENIFNKLTEDVKSHTYIIHDFDLNAEDVKAIYSHLNYLIGTRFHSVIFALTSKVKSIAIGYGGNKGKGIMEDANLSNYQIPIENLNFDILKNKFNELTVDNTYIEKVEKYLEKVNKERLDIIEDIAN